VHSFLFGGLFLPQDRHKYGVLAVIELVAVDGCQMNAVDGCKMDADI